jgi:acyl carrier protein
VDDIRAKVIEMAAEQFAHPKEQITDATHFVNDMGADSLDVVELVMQIEENFGVSIPDDKADKLQTVGDVVQYIKDNRA